jgi:hypothetical protein
MDLQSLKNMLGYANTTKHDAYLSEMLPIMLDYAKDQGVSYTADAPAGVKLFVAKAIQFNMNPSGLKGRSMGEVSYSYNTDFPPSIMRYLAPYRKAGFR